MGTAEAEAGGFYSGAQCNLTDPGFQLLLMGQKCLDAKPSGQAPIPG